MTKLPNEIRAYLLELQQEYIDGNISEEDFNEILKQIIEGFKRDESK